MEGKNMKAKSFVAVALLALSACVLPFAAARADVVMYDQADFVSGAEAFGQTLNITTPGTITVTLTAVPWLDTVTDMNAFLTTSSGVVNAIGQNSGSTFSGSESYNVGAGTYYAHWFGDAQGPGNLGVLSANITFTTGASAVALPASWLLLLSGVVFLARVKRKPLLTAAA
jgi:hypothetical protein